MALAERVIKLNYELANRQVNKLLEIASKVEKLSREDMQNAIQGTASDWKGNSARNYIGKGSSLQGKMNNNAKDIRNAANELKARAKKIYDTEMAAIEIANRRSYKG